MADNEAPGLGWTLRSYAAKIALLLLVFFAVPGIIYNEFKKAEEEQRALLLQSLETQGKLIARSLVPQLETFDESSLDAITQTLSRLAVNRINIKLLLRPKKSESGDGFYYIAAVPIVSKEYLGEEREELIASGVFDKVRETCEIGRVISLRYENPEREQEVITSVTPVQSEAGCWVVITSSRAETLLAAPIEQEYWKRPEVLLAGGIYMGMALLVLWLFVDAWLNLRRFTKHARALRSGDASKHSFASMNKVPELAGVATEFDELVTELMDSARTIQNAAEENAHAFKTPIAVITQALDPLKRRISTDQVELRRSVELIEGAVERLDALVTAARRMDEVLAKAMQRPTGRIDLSGLVGGILDGYAEIIESRGLALRHEIARGIMIRGDDEMIETILENLLDNAIDFSPHGGAVNVTLEAGRRGGAVLTVCDQGPGVPPAKLDKIFERYHSDRPRDDERNAESRHYGLGLWIVRRNAIAMGGAVTAENAVPQGLRVTVVFGHGT